MANVPVTPLGGSGGTEITDKIELTADARNKAVISQNTDQWLALETDYYSSVNELMRVAKLVVNAKTTNPKNALKLLFQANNTAGLLSYELFGTFNCPIIEGDYVGDGQQGRRIRLTTIANYVPRVLFIAGMDGFGDGIGELGIVFNFGNFFNASNGSNGIAFNLVEPVKTRSTQCKLTSQYLEVIPAQFGFNTNNIKYSYYGIGLRAPST